MIKQLLDSIAEPDRRRLMYAFEHDITQYAVIGRRYVGVNIRGVKGLKITETVGAWSCGELAEEKT